MKLSEETIEAIKLAEWLRQNHPELPFFHIAGERKCSPQYGAILKRMGVRAGVADYFFPRGNMTKKGAWLELKTITGKPSPAQREFMRDMVSEGYDFMFAYGSDEAIALIRDFYSI